MKNAITCIAAVFALSATSALAQDYMMPNAPGKAAVTGACESCHGIMTVIGHGKRAPHQWDEIVHQMISRGAPIRDADAKTIIAYLSTAYGQANDYVPSPPPVAPPSPGLALALEAAETAQHTCEANGYKKVGTLVVDSQGNTVVWLAGDNSFLNTNVVSGKTAAVLRYKTTSGEVMKRLDSDPALLAEIKADPKIKEVRQGGIPIYRGGQIIGAIAVSGDTGPTDKDEVCARAGVAKIADRLK